VKVAAIEGDCEAGGVCSLISDGEEREPRERDAGEVDAVVEGAGKVDDDWFGDGVKWSDGAKGLVGEAARPCKLRQGRSKISGVASCPYCCPTWSSCTTT
jgi:hypothetical protein